MELRAVLVKKSFVLILALLLSACGYHLRGAMELPAGIKSVYLEGGSPQLRVQFNRAMETSSVALASSPETAGMIVKIFNEDNQRRVLSLSSGGVANNFELNYRFEYEIVDSKNKVLLARQPVEIKREYFNTQQAVIAKDIEETVILNEMYQQAVRTVINRARLAFQADSK
jgi:LPS-assembly lipoprotein